MVRGIVALAVVLVSALAAGCGRASQATGLPDVDIVSLADGETTSLHDVSRPAVVNLWATWCQPCRRELPLLDRYASRYPSVSFAGVAIGEQPGDASDMVAQLGITFPQYADPDAAAADALGVSGLPVTVVVDGDGEVTVHQGELDGGELDGLLAAIGAAPPVVSAG
jgi:cytochrome c biogenesis protein CcmG, thiol:disulfide interchange protein DsbE